MTEPTLKVPERVQVRVDALVKALLVLVGVAILLPGIYLVLVLLIAALLADGMPVGGIISFLVASLTFLAGGIWLIRYALRNR